MIITRDGSWTMFQWATGWNARWYVHDGCQECGREAHPPEECPYLRRLARGAP